MKPIFKILKQITSTSKTLIKLFKPWCWQLKSSSQSRRADKRNLSRTFRFFQYQVRHHM